MHALNLTFMKKISFACLLAAVIFTALTFAGCDQRDPQAEYEVLSETVYPNPQSGIDAAQEYIDHFSNKSGNRVTEVSDIRHQYRLMDDFLSNYFSSYSEFLNKASEIDDELRQSNYQGVRETWKNLYTKEQNRLVGPIMDSITDQTFDSYFKNQVRILCQDRFTTWDYESVDRISLGTPQLTMNGLAKECSGEYRVHLRGSILGIRTETARVSISGLIGIGYGGEIAYERTGYQFLETPIF